MILNSKSALIEHLVKNGKDKTWDELASQFKLRSGETARHIWKKHRLLDPSFGKRIIVEPSGKQKIYVDTIPCPKSPQSFAENIDDGTAEITYKSDTEIRTLEELITKTNIDTNKWTISRYVQNYWGNSDQPHWQVKAWLTVKTIENKFKEEFLSFLKTYKPQPKIRKKDVGTDRFTCVVINKQDAHLNKFDIRGDNNIEARFNRIENYIDEVLTKAEKVGSIDKIVYILGSDEFNSEWNGTTTKGTPQQNIHTYHEAFNKICNHEVSVINMLLESCLELEILYIPGNHDEYVGWHLVNWLKAFYREERELKINDSPSYTKYIRYHSTAMMFNHGDDAKPSKLAGIFPMEFREFSDCKFYYIFTGDKHVEQNNDFNGIKHYQIPALSKAHGNWDSKRGYTTTKAELTTFVIDRQGGLTDIFKQTV